jgi:cytidylate kinase
MNTYTTIAIDGPAAAGKSTIAKEIAKIMGFLYVDTGALYRAIGYAALQNGIDTDDRAAVACLLPNIKLELLYENQEQRIMINGEDVTVAIRFPEVSMAASRVSAHPEVREFLLDYQRNLARSTNIVMDGRDIGTVVVPDAKIKFFLTALPEARAYRRRRDHILQGHYVEYEQLLEEIQKRDHADATRPTAPLKRADDAFLIDNTRLRREETIECMLGHISKILQTTG